MKHVFSKLHIHFTKKTILLLTAILVIAVLLLLFVFRPLFANEQKASARTAAATRGRIVKTIEGTGVIEAIDQYTISALVTGEVLADYFSEGDMVEKDTLLYEIDSTNLDFSLKKAESGVETARLSYSEALENQENQRIKAPISGVITSLNVREGDEINAGTTVAEIISADTMLLSLPFLSADAKHIFPGQTATVIPESAPALSLSGTVSSVATGSTANTYGVGITYVEILVANPGGLINGSRATATVGIYACNEAGTFSYEKTEKVIAKTGGTVTGLSVHKGDKVESGTLLFALESASAERSIQRSRLSYEDALLSRNNTFDQLDDYRIKAPITGKVIQKNVKAGDKLEGGGGNASSMAIIADLSTLTFELSVDELDIAKVQKGQEVRVTADAVEGQTFIGHVENVSIVGTSQNGVTSYPVKINLDGEENNALIPGMNVNATIVVEDKQDILLIPAAAVSRGNIVTVKGDAPETGTEKETAKPKDIPQQSADNTESASARIKQKAAEGAFASTPPEGYHYVQIETGITDGTYIEVLSGLSEGDVVLLPESVGDAGSSVTFTPNAPNAMMGMPMGNMGGMGGMRGPMTGGTRNQTGR